MKRRACIASRMQPSIVVRLCQTLRELARDRAKRLLTRARHNALRVCTSVLFIFFFPLCRWLDDPTSVNAYYIAVFNQICKESISLDMQ